MALEECGSCLNIFRMANRGQISETFMNYEAKDLLRESSTSVRVVFANWSCFDAPIGVVLAWEERGSCLNIFRMKNRGRISETFTNYEAKDLLHNESNTSVRVVFSNRSGFDAPIGVVLAWEERGSCLNIFRTKNCGRISETFKNYEGKDLLRNESNTSVRIVFTNESGFDAPIGVVSAWEDRGSCLNIFRTTNRGRISETFTNYMAKDLLRNETNTSVRVVFAYRSGFDAPIAVDMAWEERGSSLHIFRTTNRDWILKTFMKYEAKDLLRNTRQKTCCASESSTSIRVVFANRSGIDAPIGVVLAWEECGSCLNIFRSTNHGRISETFTNYEVEDLLCKSADHVLTYSISQIMVGCHKPSRITRQKTCCASESSTSVHVVFASRSGFDAPTGVVLAWEERGSCLNIFRTTNRGQISEILKNYEAKDLLRK
ncbi:uncharacterized protein G2W53_014371 [Senna tora]|uniref:Uncharacterized protein n=1 Tax=Senna tora TaxID=362788 RepID=A0A834WTD8_9FABA|nr:uncharacterized protein G2W53_014371 [Senna tora]